MDKKLKEYYINENGVLEEVKVVPNPASQIQEIEPKEKKKPLFTTNNDPVLGKKDVNKDLVENPFLYDITKEFKDDVKTIEDFYVCKGNKYYNFGALVRTKIMWAGKRKKLVKKSFKTWNEEVEKRIDDIKLIGDSQFQTSKSKLTSKVGILPFILSFLTFFASILLINGKIWIITSPTGIFNILAYASLGLSIFVILISSLYNRRANFVKNLYTKNKLVFNKSKQDLEKEYIKKYKLTYKYYTSRIGVKSKKAPLLLEKTAIGEKRIREVEEIINESNKKIIISSKKEDGLKIARFFMNALSMCAFLYVIGFAIYEIVMHFISK